MVNSLNIVTPYNTEESTPLITKQKVTSGVISQWCVYFPPGSDGGLKLRVEHGGHPLFPVNGDEWIVGDNVYINISEFIPIWDKPYILDILTANDSESFNHRLFFMVNILPFKAFSTLGIQFQSRLEEKMIENIEGF